MTRHQAWAVVVLFVVLTLWLLIGAVTQITDRRVRVVEDRVGALEVLVQLQEDLLVAQGEDIAGAYKLCLARGICVKP